MEQKTDKTIMINVILNIKETLCTQIVSTV